MPPSPPPYRDQTESELCLRFGIREHVYEDIEDVDTKSVENVCNFINNNDVFSLLELPGLKYNKTKPQPPSLTTPPLPPKRTKEENKGRKTKSNNSKNGNSGKTLGKRNAKRETTKG